MKKLSSRVQSRIAFRAKKIRVHEATWSNSKDHARRMVELGEEQSEMGNTSLALTAERLAEGSYRQARLHRRLANELAIDQKLDKQLLKQCQFVENGWPIEDVLIVETGQIEPR